MHWQARARGTHLARWKLRAAVKVVNQVLASLRLDKHPDKTFIGSLAKGFDFLGYHFRPGCFTVAAKTLAHFVARVHQLYEREREKPCGSSTPGAYVRRYRRWVRAGLTCDDRWVAGLSYCRRRPMCPRARAGCARR